MGDKLERLFRTILLVVSVVFGPVIWKIALVFARSAWEPGNDDRTLLYCLAVSYVLMRGAVKGILEGPERLPRWLFLIASVLNGYEAFERMVSELPDKFLSMSLLLAYSLWQFFMWSRPEHRSND